MNHQFGDELTTNYVFPYWYLVLWGCCRNLYRRPFRKFGGQTLSLAMFFRPACLAPLMINSFLSFLSFHFFQIAIARLCVLKPPLNNDHIRYHTICIHFIGGFYGIYHTISAYFL